MEKLSWEQIRERYDGEWVELIDYVWDEGEPYPAEGAVRTHAASRKEFNSLVLGQPPAGAARLFVGDVVRGTGFRSSGQAGNR